MAQLKADDEGVRKAHGYYEEMTAQLIDSHYSLTFSNRTLENISPASARLLKRPDFHNHIPPQHYTQTIVGTYLNPSSRLGYSTDSTSIMVAGTIRNTTILYFRIPEFDLQDWYETGTSSQKATIQYVIDQLGQSETTGLIIDVRGNGGGAVADLNFLVGRLVDKPYAYGQYRAKAGPGRLDFLPWVESTVFPPAGSKAFTKPVIVIADMHSVSMSEATAMAVRALPGGNGRVVGERTFGAQAPISPNAAYNAGSFSTGFVRLVYASSMMFRYKDGVCYEGSGFPPDVEAPYDGTSLETGKDTQLEKAISQVR
jgi:C-terminal processing protease CtpA/Prc